MNTTEFWKLLLNGAAVLFSAAAIFFAIPELGYFAIFLNFIANCLK